MTAIHLCLSGSLACSGMNPCEPCLAEIRHRVLPRAAMRAGYNGSPEQFHAMLEGYMEGWQLFQQALAMDPSLRARVQMRDVSEAQSTAPVARLGDGDGPMGQPPPPEAWPTTQAAPPGWPWGPVPGQPSSSSPAGAQAQPIGTAPMPPSEAQPIGTAPAAPPRIDPLSANLTLDDLARIQAQARGGAVVTKVTKAPKPPPMSAEDIARAGGPASKNAPG